MGTQEHLQLDAISKYTGTSTLPNRTYLILILVTDFYNC